MAMDQAEVTLGVEEEYLLLDVGSGLPASRARQVTEAADLDRVLARGEVDHELLQALVEVATPVCGRLEEVETQLFRLRHAVRRAALSSDCVAAATGAAPVATGAAVPVTPQQRYHAMREEAAQLVDEQLICGMHVHIAVPGRAAGAAALGRLRPWLPVLVALGANSPYWQARDTGFASWRTVVFGRWPVSGPPPYIADAVDYERRVEALLGTGVIPDRRQLYWHARLSEQYPTLEVRAPDTQIDVDSAVTLAGLVRGLVATALQEARRGVRPLDPPASVLNAAGWHAARHGLDDVLVDPRRGEPAPAADVVRALFAHAAPALRALGDHERVGAGLARILAHGTGAARQRRAMRAGGLDELLALIADLAPATAAGRG